MTSLILRCLCETKSLDLIKISYVFAALRSNKTITPLQLQRDDKQLYIMLKLRFIVCPTMISSTP